jgi:hypothetical protein
MKWIPLLVALALLIPIVFYASNTGTKKRLLYPDNHIASFNAILKEEFIRRVPKTTELRVRDFPTLSPWHRMTKFITCFLDAPSIKIKEQEEAIRIAIPYAQAYVDTINNTPLIRPYLTTFPMDQEMWDFCFGFAKDKKTHLPFYFPYISSLLFIGGKLEIPSFFKTVTYPNGITAHDSYDNLNDPSKEIPDEFKQVLLPRFDKKDEKIPQTIVSSKKYAYFNDCMKPTYNFCTEYAQKNGLFFIAFEDAFGYFFKDQKIHSEIVYAAQGKLLSLDEAKKFALKFRNDHSLFYLSSPSFEEHVNSLRMEGTESRTNPVNIQKFLAFRISFWDEYIDRVQAPAIAEIQVYGTRARYFVADELQRLQLICEEEFPSLEKDIPFSEQKA